MSTMIERVARALCEICDGEPDYLEPGDAYGIDGYRANGDPCHFLWRHYTNKAEAAIMAMREPTDEMISEGESLASIGIGKPNDDESLPRVWRGMIDVALKDEKLS